MSTLFTGISELLTPGERFERAALAVDGERVSWLGSEGDAPPGGYARRIDLGNRAVLPGLIDSHTHLVWAGSRLDEYLRRSRGESYSEILEAGGGIHATVAATRAASAEELYDLAAKRADLFLAGGVTTLEVKSGYGLDPETEVKMLEVIGRLEAERPQNFVATLLAHVVPADRSREAHLDMFCRELIPEVARRRLASAVDVFCDRGAFTLGETRRIFEAALERGLAIKAHAEQIEHSGAARLVAEFGGLSADHLERSGPDDWRRLAEAGVVATLLPGATVLLRQSFPDARAMRAAGVRIAVASDHNPGSSPLYALLPAAQLALALGGLSAAEALASVTEVAAEALARPDLGRLAPGGRADFVVVEGEQAMLPLYRWGPPPLHAVYLAGEERWRAR